MTVLRVGMGRAVITPQRPGAPAGWSVVGQRVGGLAPGAADLVATAMALDDGRGSPVVLVFADLHGGGGALWRALAEQTGVPQERLILAGSHTHAGPGHIYDSVFYNAFTTPSIRLSPTRARSLARAIAPAVRQAVSGRVVGGLAFGRKAAHGLASNRAVPAALRLPLAEVAAFGRVGPGRDAPNAPLADTLRDPRVSACVVVDERGKPFGVLATAAIHGTCLGRTHPHWSADWGGPARTTVEAAVSKVLVGWAGSASGDVSPLALDEDGHPRMVTSGPRVGVEQGPDLAQVVGEGLGTALQALVAEIGSKAESWPIGSAHEIWDPTADPRLGRPTPGLATAGGGVDGHPDDGTWEALSPGVKGTAYARHAKWVMAPPHAPKIPIEHSHNLRLVPVSSAVSRLGPRALPLHAVRIGDVTLVTIPGEATTFVGWRIERAVHEAVGGRVWVVGYANEYAGYWTTPEGYDEQRYEGSSTLYGREASTVLCERLVALARRAHEDSNLEEA